MSDMTDRDNITLPREVVQEAVEALELEATSPPLETTAAAMAALRTYLAAPSLEVTVDPLLTAEEAAAISAAIDARKKEQSEDKTHPGYVIGSHWLETAYSRICAGEAEADVLRDCGWERVDEALRRDAERYRWLRDMDGMYDWRVTVFGTMEGDLDAAIDAAMKENKT